MKIEFVLIVDVDTIKIVQTVAVLRSGINVFMQNKSNCEDLSFKRLFHLRAFCGTP